MTEQVLESRARVPMMQDDEDVSIVASAGQGGSVELFAIDILETHGWTLPPVRARLLAAQLVAAAEAAEGPAAATPSAVHAGT